MAARKDPRTRAVVLLVDSPGGAANASDLMWREVVRLAEAKPVVASFGDVAASGGYYLACGAREIVAAPGTLTGSIGVLAGKLDASDLLARVGLRVELLTRGPAAAMLHASQPLSDEARRRLEHEVDGLYAQFVDKVAAGRKLSREAALAVAEGRVWTGRAASTRGLVDHLGGVPLALERARALAGLPARPAGDHADVDDVRPGRRGGLVQRLTGLGARAAAPAAPWPALDDGTARTVELGLALASPAPLALWDALPNVAGRPVGGGE